MFGPLNGLKCTDKTISFDQLMKRNQDICRTRENIEFFSRVALISYKNCESAYATEGRAHMTTTHIDEIVDKIITMIIIIIIINKVRKHRFTAAKSSFPV